MAGVSGQVTASEASVRTIETGVYYELDKRGEFGKNQLDSRPRFTIDRSRENLVFGNDVSQARVNAVSEKAAFINEKPVGQGNAAEARHSQQSVDSIPTELSVRMRPKSGITLASPHTLPEVMVQRRGANPKLVVSGKRSFELETGTGREVRLPTEMLSVETVEVVEEAVPIEGRPKHRWGPKREYGSTEVEATPVVRVNDHGELGVRRREMA